MATLFIASDHAGVALKKFLTEHPFLDFSWKDLGPMDESAVDYPDFAEKCGHAVQAESGSYGILICGSGIGMSIAANKMKGIRAALCHSPEYARLSRMHNHANVLCLGARFLKNDEALAILDTFLGTLPSEEPRHVQRVIKADKL